MKEKLTPEEEYYLSQARLNKALTIRSYIKSGIGAGLAILLFIFCLMMAKLFFFGF